MSKQVAKWNCEVCGSEYESQAEADECEKRPRETLPVNVGDIVISKSGYGWYDGDRAWITNPDIKVRPAKCPNGNGNCFMPCCTYVFLYVVTHTDMDTAEWSRRAHRTRYHLATRAMSGKSGHHSGYTFSSGHYPMTLVHKPAAAVVKSSKALLGLKATTLL